MTSLKKWSEARAERIKKLLVRPDAFERWLLEDLTGMAGRTNDSEQCPVSRWLDEAVSARLDPGRSGFTVTGVSVDAFTVTVTTSDGHHGSARYVPMSEWASRFVQAFDSLRGASRTKRDARDVLRRVLETAA